MKAPNKIHIHIGGLGLMAATQITVNAPGEEEYIRKDALLEWANGKMTIERATEGIVGGYDFALKELINHINSL